jgi:predicted GIY-YIG superfamily endonuclease
LAIQLILKTGVGQKRSTKGFTASGKPWRLVHYECFPTKELAMKREKHLKAWKNINQSSEVSEVGFILIRK